jgi:glycosyltransferase involved in cell wall biosynthesis
MKKNSLSLIIFALNEDKIIGQVLKEYCEFFKKFDFDLEVIFLDDGSDDQTFEKSLELRKNYAFLKCVKNEKNIGIGKTIKKGFDLATSEYVTYMPGDCAFDLSSLHSSLLKFKNFDFIICARANNKQRNFKRFFLSRLLTLILNFIFRQNLIDYNAFVIVKKRLINEIVLFQDQTISWTLILQLMWKKYNYCEIHVKIKIPEPGNQSTAINLKSFYINFLGLIKLLKIKWKI